ncbi:hypothetical protein CZP2022_21 [Vibrio phage C-ZP2022]|nr:hypothetical protein CZP2022_21 [Vibrio phage C-ZP2022]
MKNSIANIKAAIINNVLIMAVLKAIAGVFADMILLSNNAHIKANTAAGKSYKERVKAMVEYTTDLWFNNYSLFSVLGFAAIIGVDYTLWLLAVSGVLSLAMILVPSLVINENVLASAEELKAKTEAFKLDLA